MSYLAKSLDTFRHPKLKQLGLFGFLFFSVKGLLWLGFVYFAHSFI